ncbi:hypothetical protein GCM10012275_50390 [Longimycelium tulufanense]|uniref:ABM domain-containing protein n=1 Tax=Longimycelium tulufanense TaxID=907463 RepID=A0A8J3FW32_9PSEU|nr:antibiotic biosynthesis monooxygenase [Longimycelium tulufanense]GGM73594.1 hypothetical protein GCM10012275_50390 [Longimycelium tulufanense]
MFGLVVRFELRDEDSARMFDELVSEIAPKIREQEPGTLLYVVHTVADSPLSRVFYELYADQSAFEDHESQLHVKRFLREREQCLSDVRVEFVTPTGGKGLNTSA